MAAPSLLSACSSTSGSTLEKIENGETIKIAYGDEVPYAYTDNGNVVGAAVSMYTEVFKQLGADESQFEWVQTEFGNLIKNLGANHDLVVAGMFITPDRCENALFADPDYVMPDAMMTLAGNPKGLENLESFVDSDAILGVMKGTSELEYATSLGVQEDRINSQENLDALIRELKADRLDGIALTDVNLRLAAEADPEVEVGPAFTPVVDGKEQIGAGAAVFQGKDTDLRDKVNEKIKGIVADEEKWFSIVKDHSFTKDYYPGTDLTAKSLCGDAYK